MHEDFLPAGCEETVDAVSIWMCNTSPQLIISCTYAITL